MHAFDTTEVQARFHGVPELGAVIERASGLHPMPGALNARSMTAPSSGTSWKCLNFSSIVDMHKGADTMVKK